MEQARVAICHAFSFEFKNGTDRCSPTYIFSIPEVEWVGLTEGQAQGEGIDYEVGWCFLSAPTPRLGSRDFLPDW
jgi:NAD(P) transhydrogenase